MRVYLLFIKKKTHTHTHTHSNRTSLCMAGSLICFVLTIPGFELALKKQLKKFKSQFFAEILHKPILHLFSFASYIFLAVFVVTLISILSLEICVEWIY